MANRLSTRLLLGAIAGVAGTVAMTAAMNRMHRRLPGPNNIRSHRARSRRAWSGSETTK
jgi:hypothetical protein